MDEMTVQELKKILEDTKELGGKKIDITGGEPTMREDLDEIIKIGKKLGYKIELVTNGSLLNKKRLRKFKEYGLDGIAISLDGSTHEVYSRIRKVSKETYEKVLQTIEDAISLGIYTKVNTVVFKSNLEDLPNITKLCIEKGVNENGIYYFTPVGRGKRENENSVEPIEWLTFLRHKLMKFGSKIKLSVEVPLIEKNFTMSQLGCILKEDPYHLQILPNGNVFPCAIMASYNLPVANLREKSIKDVWEDDNLWKEHYKKVYSKIFKKKGEYCVNFKTFKVNGYDKDKYKPVCPLRKFIISDLR